MSPPPEPSPGLVRRNIADPAGVVLMLHGGRENGVAAVRQADRSFLRSALMMAQIAERVRSGGMALWLLRYSVQGWNAAAGTPSPLGDARWALDRVRRELGPLPVVLLGHSMGARTAVAVAGDESVVGVVALAPWLPAMEPVDQLAGRHLAAAHGSADRVTNADQTAQFVRRASRVTASSEFLDMGPVGHYLLRGMSTWNHFAASRALSWSTGAAPSGDATG
jgi:predicted esterase